MEIRGTHHYPSGISDVFRFFCEADRIEQKYQALGAKNIKILSLQDNNGEFDSKTSREMPADVPSVLKSILGAYNRITQTEHWGKHPEGGLLCEMTVKVEGVPVSIAGTMHLKPLDDGSVNEVLINVQSNIPLLGKKLAEFIAGDAKKTMEDEYRYIHDHLA